MTAPSYSLAELLICAASEAWRDDGEVLATGIGVIPRLAASLSMLSSNPALLMTDSEAFMNERQREYFRDKLIAWKEEILKEAMRANPDRLAIRTKLLEVYAKRRDTKGYEQLAVQLYELTNGQGEDWLKAQEMGLGTAPENPLYQPGGQPSSTPLSVEAGRS